MQFRVDDIVAFAKPPDSLRGVAVLWTPGHMMR